MGKVKIVTNMQNMVDQLPSSVASPLLLALGTALVGADDRADPPAPGLSLELNKLWKKFWRTSC